MSFWAEAITKRASVTGKIQMHMDISEPGMVVQNSHWQNVENKCSTIVQVHYVRTKALMLKILCLHKPPYNHQILRKQMGAWGNVGVLRVHTYCHVNRELKL